jgi:hypothetical protein
MVAVPLFGLAIPLSEKVDHQAEFYWTRTPVDLNYLLEALVE